MRIAWVGARRALRANMMDVVDQTGGYTASAKA